MIASNMTRRSALLMLSAAAATMSLTPGAFAASVNLNNTGVAVQGYDPVAYFTDDAAVRGDSTITAQYDGATYHFASAENRDAFVANPAQYAPAYGGFCAFAVANGYTAKIDPAAYSVVDGKLYLNFSKGVRSRWNRDIPGNITKGNANWPSLSRQ
ncbi:MAG: YHS domain-containing (seleno)protein [Ahrensia sp.]